MMDVNNVITKYVIPTIIICIIIFIFLIIKYIIGGIKMGLFKKKKDEELKQQPQIVPQGVVQQQPIVPPVVQPEQLGIPPVPGITDIPPTPEYVVEEPEEPKVEGVAKKKRVGKRKTLDKTTDLNKIVIEFVKELESRDKTELIEMILKLVLERV